MTPAPPDLASRRSILRIVVKAVILCLLVNFGYALVDALPMLGRLSVYNAIIPGRARLPYAEDPELAYSVSIDDVEALLASHEISAPRQPGEFRVFILGDSSVWGFLLRPEETLTGQLNRMGLLLSDGRRVRAFNLGYPVMSLLKDLTLMQASLSRHPDLIVWMTSLEAFPPDKQLASAVVQARPEATREWIEAFALPIAPDSPELSPPSFWDRTLVGQRRALADWIRLQLYGVMWTATGIDQSYPETYELRPVDLTDDLGYHGILPPELPPSALSFEVIEAGVQLLDGIPLLVVNEPIFISDGENSDLRYNDLYPRWAYDAYRSLLASRCAAQGWECLDLWDSIAAEEFTNTAIHLTPTGTGVLAEQIAAAIRNVAEQAAGP